MCPGASKVFLMKKINAMTMNYYLRIIYINYWQMNFSFFTGKNDQILSAPMNPSVTETSEKI